MKTEKRKSIHPGVNQKNLAYKPKAKALLGIIGMVKDNKKDIAEKHDMYLCDAFAESGNKSKKLSQIAKSGKLAGTLVREKGIISPVNEKQGAGRNKLARIGRGKAFNKKKRNNDELLLDIELGRIAAKRDRTVKKWITKK